jgi:hypothetical protein
MASIVLTGNMRIMIGVCGSPWVLMLVPMLIYVVSDDLAWWPRSQPHQPTSGAALK